MQSSSLVGPAILKGNKLSVKAKCPTKVNATCTISLHGHADKQEGRHRGAQGQGQEGGKTKNVRPHGQAGRPKMVKTKKKLLFKETVQGRQVQGHRLQVDEAGT